jgi:plasmid stabilization system protein ParE
MPGMQRTTQAEEDLIEIWIYSARQWGEAQADKYLHTLEACCRKIDSGEIAGKQPLSSYPRLRVVRCGQHYLFFLTGEVLVLIAVLHEKMDCIARLQSRFA